MLYIVLTLTPPNALQAKLNQSKTLQVERATHTRDVVVVVVGRRTAAQCFIWVKFEELWHPRDTNPNNATDRESTPRSTLRATRTLCHSD